jgi:hypothetical protein
VKVTFFLFSSRPWQLGLVQNFQRKEEEPTSLSLACQSLNWSPQVTVFLWCMKEGCWHPMKGLCLNLTKDHDYPPNCGIVFLHKNIISEEREHTSDYSVLSDDDDDLLASCCHHPKDKCPLK